MPLGLANVHKWVNINKRWPKRFVAARLGTQLAFTTEMEHDTAIPSSELPGGGLLYLHETNIHGLYT